MSVFLCIANQDLSQLDETMAKTVLSIDNFVVFNSNPRDCRVLIDVLGDPVQIRDITSLNVGEAFCRFGQMAPIKLKLHPPQKSKKRMLKQIKQKSFSEYCVLPEHNPIVTRTYDFD